MRERGEPVRVSRDSMEYFMQALSKKGGKLSETPYHLITPDHILEARIDGAITFLEERLYPLIIDSASDPSIDEVLNVAGEFIEEFGQKHPGDFDIKEPLDLIQIASNKNLTLQMVYMARAKVHIDEQEILDLTVRAGDLMTRVIDEYFPDDEED